MDAAALLTRLAEVIDAHDWDGLAGFLHDDFAAFEVRAAEFADAQGALFGCALEMKDAVAEELQVVIGRLCAALGGEDDCGAVLGQEADEGERLLVELERVWSKVAELRDRIEEDARRLQG